MVRPRVALIIPAYNEKETIGLLISRIRSFGDPFVVDDCSTDATGSIALQCGAIVLKHELNKGYDASLNTGLKIAFNQGYDILITLDADGQHPPEVIPKLIGAIESGADLALGVRHRQARLAEYCFSLYTRLVYGVSDPLCGLKAYRSDVYERLGHVDSYGSIGVELTLFSARCGSHIKQIPFRTAQRSGPARFGSTLVANKKIFNALWKTIIKFHQVAKY